MNSGGKTLYLDCVSGISGDMTLAMLIDLGADLDYIRTQLRLLPFDSFKMEVEPVVKRGISAKRLLLEIGEAKQTAPDGANGHEHQHAHYHHHHHHHHYDSNGSGTATHEQSDAGKHAHEHSHMHRKAADIISEIEQSALPERVKQRSVAIFRAIAQAEGKIHGLSADEVHFHEVGAMDSIIDIVGVCLAMESLDIGSLQCSPVPVGSGKTRMAHGLYPIPAPATAELLIGIPLAELNVKGELTTPTGAGIIKALASEFGPLPAATIQRIGYGAGMKDFEHPNVLRGLLLDMGKQEATEKVIVLEAQVDDSIGELLGYTMERLLQAGALDVYFTPVYMKKNRPGVLLTVLAKPELADQCERLLLQETSTLGVRHSEWKRRVLRRKLVTVQTKFGAVRIKQALDGETLLHQSPEYEDAALLARQHGVALQEVYAEAMAAVRNS